MIGVDAVTRTRREVVAGIPQDVVTDLPAALFSPADTAPATDESSEPVVPAPTLYWFQQWPDVVDTDRLTVRGVTYDVFVTPADWRGNGMGGLVVRLRMDRLAGLEFGRADAVSKFTETFTAFTVAKVLNQSTGANVAVETVMYPDVSGAVKYPTLTVSERESAAQVPAVQDVEVQVAVGATPNVAVNVMWRVTASTVDSSLVGRVYRTKGLPQAGFVVAHKYPVEAVS